MDCGATCGDLFRSNSGGFSDIKKLGFVCVCVCVSMCLIWVIVNSTGFVFESLFSISLCMWSEFYFSVCVYLRDCVLVVVLVYLCRSKICIGVFRILFSFRSVCTTDFFILIYCSLFPFRVFVCFCIVLVMSLGFSI